jgi:hypothetical protein
VVKVEWKPFGRTALVATVAGVTIYVRQIADGWLVNVSGPLCDTESCPPLPTLDEAKRWAVRVARSEFEAAMRAVEKLAPKESA